MVTLHREHFSGSSCKNQHACHDMLPSTASKQRVFEVIHSTITRYQTHYALHDLKSLSFDFYYTFKFISEVCRVESRKHGHPYKIYIIWL